MSKWTQMVEYINNKPIGTIIYRKEITFFEDNYKNWLTHCKNLETIDKGEYKILKHINTKYSANDIRKRAYNPDFFIEFDINQDRFEKLNDILNED